MVRRESGFLREAVQSATAAMEDVSGSQVAGVSDPSAPQTSGAVALDAGTGGAGSSGREAARDRREEHGGGSEITSIRTDEQRRVPRDPRELAELLTDPAGYTREHSQRRMAGRLRTVDGRISADVAATFAAHCDADLGKVSQADVVEVLIRAYLSDAGVEIRRPFA